jgi:hypothetical protein
MSKKEAKVQCVIWTQVHFLISSGFQAVVHILATIIPVLAGAFRDAGACGCAVVSHANLKPFHDDFVDFGCEFSRSTAFAVSSSHDGYYNK